MVRRARDTVVAATGGQQEPFVYGSLPSRGMYLAAAPDSPPAEDAQPTAPQRAMVPRPTA